MKLLTPAAMEKGKSSSFKSESLPVVDHSIAFAAIQPGLREAVSQPDSTFEQCDDLRDAIVRRMADEPQAPKNFAAFYSVAMLRIGGIPKAFPPVLPLLRSSKLALNSQTQPTQQRDHVDPAAASSGSSSSSGGLGPVTSLDHIAVSITASSRLRDVNTYVEHIDNELLKAEKDDPPRRIANVASNLARLGRILSAIGRDHYSLDYGPSAGAFDKLLVRPADPATKVLSDTAPPLAPLAELAEKAARHDTLSIEKTSKFGTPLDLPPRVLPKSACARYIFFGITVTEEQLAEEPQSTGTVLRKLQKLMPADTRLTAWRCWLMSFVLDSIDVGTRLTDLVEWIVDVASPGQDCIYDRPSIAILMRIAEIERIAQILNLPRTHPDGNPDYINAFAICLAAASVKPSAYLCSLLIETGMYVTAPLPDKFSIPMSLELKPTPKYDSMQWTKLMFWETWWSLRGAARTIDDPARWAHVAASMHFTHSGARAKTSDGKSLTAFEAALRSVKLGGDPTLVLGFILKGKLEDALREHCSMPQDDVVRKHVSALPSVDLSEIEMGVLSTSEAIARCINMHSKKDHYAMSLVALLLASLDAQSWHGPARWEALRRGGLPPGGVPCSNGAASASTIEEATHENIKVVFSVQQPDATKGVKIARHVCTIIDTTANRGVTVSAQEAYFAAVPVKLERSHETLADLPHALFGLATTAALEQGSSATGQALQATFHHTVTILKRIAVPGSPRVLRASWEALTTSAANGAEWIDTSLLPPTIAASAASN